MTVYRIRYTYDRSQSSRRSRHAVEVSTDDDLAPVVPLRSDEEELELLETAVLDALDERDGDRVDVDPRDRSIQPFGRDPSRA